MASSSTAGTGPQLPSDLSARLQALLRVTSFIVITMTSCASIKVRGSDYRCELSSNCLDRGWPTVANDPRAGPSRRGTTGLTSRSPTIGDIIVLSRLLRSSVQDY